MGNVKSTLRIKLIPAVPEVPVLSYRLQTAALGQQVSNHHGQQSDFQSRCLVEPLLRALTIIKRFLCKSMGAMVTLASAARSA